MSCNCDKTVHTPEPCNTQDNCRPSNTMRLFTLRCGTWVYSGQMSINSAPQRGMRIMWEDKSYTVEQATLLSGGGCASALVGSEPGTDKWEVMLIQAEPQYITGSSHCTPCQTAVQPPLEAPGGVYIDNPACSTTNYPAPSYPYNPLPVEQGLGCWHSHLPTGGCGPHYTCTGYPN